LFYNTNAEEVLKRIKDNESLPVLSHILLLSRGGPIYKWVCATMMKCVVGNSAWSYRHFKEPLSDIATESDESFLILTIENNFARWMSEIVVAADGQNKTLAPAKYTNSGKSTSGGQGSSRRFHGWSRDGYLRFNVLHAMVKEDRKQRANFEQELQREFQEDNTKRRKDVSGSGEDTVAEIFPANDLAGVQPPQQATLDTTQASEDEEAACSEQEEDEEGYES
jgi:hypothetical protein